MAALQEQAFARGLTEVTLASALLEVMATDRLYDAVLDN